MSTSILMRSKHPKLTEELLVEKLDVFLANIESRLESFDQFFKFKLEQLGPKGFKQLSSEDSSPSSSSYGSIKLFLIKRLNTVHERLQVVKLLVLRHSISNLEYLYLTIEDQYNYLFNTKLEDHQDVEDVGTSNSPTEVLMEKIIQSMLFFDQKLTLIDRFISDNTPDATADYLHDSIFSNLKFFNFNRALKAAETRLLHYYELPLLWRENKYIIEGYRFLLSHREIWKLMLSFNHNETMNIWTHLAGLAILIYLSAWHLPLTAVYARNSTLDNAAIYVFLIAACECMFSLAVWHTYLGCAHYRSRSRCASVDYTGITVLITCSIISAEYTMLYHHPKLLSIYVAFLIMCGLVGAGFNWVPYFDRPECRYMRIGFFAGLAFLGATSAACMCYYEGLLVALRFFVPVLYQSISFYWIGVMFYGGLIPERWRYDVIIDDGVSHKIHKNHEHKDYEIENHYDALDVLLGTVDKSGLQEMDEIETEMCEVIGERDSPTKTCDDIIDRHFPEHTHKTPYANDFMSLWWVDYFMSSHNIWHICVVLGVVGHYFTLLQMFEKIVR